MTTAKQILESFALVGKITEQHALDIQEILTTLQAEHQTELKNVNSENEQLRDLITKERIEHDVRLEAIAIRVREEEANEYNKIIEEVRREERAKVAQELLDYQNESGNSHIDIEWFAQCLFTPTHAEEKIISDKE